MKSQLCLVLSLAFMSPMAAGASLAQLEQALKKQPSNFRLREQLAEVYNQQKRDEKVIEVLAPYSNEISAESLRMLASAYETKKEYLNQIRTLEIYEQRTPNMFRPNYLLGLAYKNNGQLDKAIEHLRKSIGFAPKHRPSYDALLDIFREQKQNYESRVLLNDMVKNFGQKKEFLNFQCELYVKDGFLAEAQTSCKKAIQTNPKFPANHVYLAQTYSYQQNSKAEEKVLITAARQFTNDEFVQWSTGEFYYREKNFPIAIRYLKQAIKADPKSGRAQYGLALSLFESGQYKEALDPFVQACVLDETKVAREAFRTSASKLRQSGNSKLADEYDKKYVKCL